MKHMNNPYVSKLFKHARFAAEDGGEQGAGEEGDVGAGGSSPDGGTDNEPSVADLKMQLAKAQAQADRYKNSIDNLTKKNGELTKQNRQYMNDEQRAAAEQEERNQELEDLRREVRVSKYAKRFVGLGMSEEDADGMAGLMPEIDDADAFFGNLGKYIENVQKVSAETAVQKLLKDRPEINAGNGDGSGKTLAEEKAIELAKNQTGATSNTIADYYKIKK